MQEVHRSIFFMSEKLLTEITVSTRICINKFTFSSTLKRRNRYIYKSEKKKRRVSKCCEEMNNSTAVAAV